MITNNFVARHLGIREEDLPVMLKKIGLANIDELIYETVPDQVRLENPLNLAEGINEFEYINHLKSLGQKNKQYRSFTGMGYYPAILPPVIQRNMLENAGWYTAYTPYQAEISQGRLEALLNFQTVVSDLTAMPLSNCSLLDEGTAAAEAMLMSFNGRSRSKTKAGANKYFVDKEIFPQTLALLETRAKPLGIELIIGDYQNLEMDATYFGVILQYPNNKGAVIDYTSIVAMAQENEALVTAIADLMSLTMLKAPGEWGADIVVGSSQRFGIPMGFGGPHAGFLATTDKFKRNMPGRIIGISKDSQGNSALRMALQTREQHIKREKATSNICTAQALLASMAAMYAAYHGPQGLLNIAQDIHQNAVALSEGLEALGYQQENEVFFDTLYVKGIKNIALIAQAALNKEINLRYFKDAVGISINETTSLDDLNDILEIFAQTEEGESVAMDDLIPETIIPEAFQRTSKYLTHPVFNRYHSETELMRYIKKLERKDLALNHSMISLGSCTMKLNAATEMLPFSDPNLGNIHPFVPVKQVAGYQLMLKKLEDRLTEITGFSGIPYNLIPGLKGNMLDSMVIRAYHESRGDNTPKHLFDSFFSPWNQPC